MIVPYSIQLKDDLICITVLRGSLELTQQVYVCIVTAKGHKLSDTICEYKVEIESAPPIRRRFLSKQINGFMALTSTSQPSII